ncbi:MAG: TIGR04283 family arsenosugar biosynthesis glycosyltransferase, partial [Paracoccaceae bacterium]
MPAPITVVIPTLNAQDGLPACLAALMEGLEAGLLRELVVTDGGSTDATLAVAEAAGARVVTGAAGRGGQLRRGVAKARGDWVLILHADTVLQPGWARVVSDVVTRGGQTAWYFRLAFDATGVAPAWVAGWANLRSRWFGLPYGDQGLLMCKARYDRVGGYRDIPLMEDVAMAHALRRDGGAARGLPVVAVTSAARYQRDGWLRRGTRNV